MIRMVSLVLVLLASVALSACTRSVYGSYDDGPRVVYNEPTDGRPAYVDDRNLRDGY
jgi:hypothetical protein